jgi:hypothetical protein
MTNLETPDPRRRPPEHPLHEKFLRINALVVRLEEAGLITPADRNAIFQRYVDIVIYDAGILGVDYSDPAHPPVVRHALHAMERKLVELHPELRDQVEALDGGPRL